VRGSTDYPGGVVRGQIDGTPVNHAYETIHPKAQRYHKQRAKRAAKRHGDKREYREPSGAPHKGKSCPI
jgi:sRNA-binding protein